MATKGQNGGLAHSAICGIVFAALVATASHTLAQDASELSPDIPELNSTESHNPEAWRSSIKNVVVIAGQGPANQAVTGTYDKETAGLLEGIDSGSKMGTVTKEIGGTPVSVRVIPGLAIPGAIFGGLSSATKREIQEFRDELTEQIAQAESPPLSNDGLAQDVFWGLRKLPHLGSKLFAPTVEIPADTDAILYVSLDKLTIDVQGKDAIITASAVATLRRSSDGKNVYETVIQYQDRDNLKNWTENDNELWRDYTNFARFYLGREISAEVFDRVELNHSLRPVETDTAERARKNERKFVSQSLTPTLAWELTLDGEDSHSSWTDTIGESDIFYDVEIFDNRHLVYYEEQVPDPRHTVAFELEACHLYRWSVRPAYHVDGEIRFGEWMRFGRDSNTEKATEKGLFGMQASEAPAYVQDFAMLEIDCRRR